MAIYKCKMCGGTLECEGNNSVITCDFCGITQTVHSFDNEKKVTLFKRANNLRYKCEFDKASALYETIISEFPNEAEAYWGLVLCKYGIEYVDDPNSGKKIPTCHRTEFSSILNDFDYKNAIENSDVIAKDVYLSEAKAIDLLQKNILALSNKENPVDIFICYKETTNGGARTEDSVIAHEIYDELIKKGYTVFFSRVTLESKLGSEYEPIIFSAINSAKVMIHVTTSEENSESIWVRNEWSRYLSLIKHGQKKTLIPCYKGITPYELPQELQNLQGQDLSKLGSLQDLVRGIEKICGKKNEKKSGITQSDLYLKHLEQAKIYLSNSLWNEAIEEYTSASKLSDNPGVAYLGLLYASSRVKTVKGFCSKHIKPELEKNSYFINAKKYINEETKADVEQIQNMLSNILADNIINNVKQLILAGDWKAADDVLKENNNPKIKDSVIVFKYERLILKANVEYNIYVIDKLEDLIEMANTINEYNDVSSYIQKLINIKNKIIEDNKAYCVQNFKINIPDKINIVNLYLLAWKCNMIKTSMVNFKFYDEKDKKLFHLKINDIYLFIKEKLKDSNIIKDVDKLLINEINNIVNS